MSNIDPKRDEKVKEKPRTKRKRPDLYRVLLHNDDYTTMEFVIHVLIEFFHKDETEATAIMLHVHTKGIGIAGVFTRDIAETKVSKVMQYAEENGMPLLLTTEPE